MFNIIEVTEHFNRRGDVIKTESRVVFSHENVVETAKYRFDNSERGCFKTTPTANMSSCVHFRTEQDGVDIDFAEMYRIVEGDDAYNAILNDDSASVNEAEWVASK